MVYILIYIYIKDLYNSQHRVFFPSKTEFVKQMLNLLNQRTNSSPILPTYIVLPGNHGQHIAVPQLKDRKIRGPNRKDQGLIPRDDFRNLSHSISVFLLFLLVSLALELPSKAPCTARFAGGLKRR